MEREQTLQCNEGFFHMVLPQFHPKRLWTQPASDRFGAVRQSCTAHAGICANRRSKPLDALTVTAQVPHFSIKGGFMCAPQGERRLVISGKIIRHRDV